MSIETIDQSTELLSQEGLFTLEEQYASAAWIAMFGIYQSFTYKARRDSKLNSSTQDVIRAFGNQKHGLDRKLHKWSKAGLHKSEQANSMHHLGILNNCGLFDTDFEIAFSLAYSQDPLIFEIASDAKFVRLREPLKECRDYYIGQIATAQYITAEKLAEIKRHIQFYVGQYDPFN